MLTRAALAASLAFGVVVPLVACGGADATPAKSTTGATTDQATVVAGGGTKRYGEPHDGVYNLGPVDFAETRWHNACGPFEPEVPKLYGAHLAGLALAWNGGGQLCDACITMTAKKSGKTIVARVVTHGETHGPNDVDLSEAAYDELFGGEEPRLMTWQLTDCPDTGPLRFQFQTGAHIDWTSLWVRNPRVALDKVEVKSARHDFKPLRRETDGTLNDDNGFGEGEFTFRLTAVDGQVIEETFPKFSPGEVLVGTKQFQ